MSASLNTTLPIPRVPVFDVDTGILHPAWYRFFLALLNRTGGGPGVAGVPGGVSGNVQFNDAGAFGGLTNAQLTALVQLFSTTLKGAVPASGGGTVNFLRADGTWDAPSGAGSVTSIVAGPGLAGGTITSTGTISLGTIAASELLGNFGTVAGVPAGVAVGTGLSLSVAGTLTNSAPDTNIWNAGTVTTIGSNVTLTAGTLSASAPGTGTVTQVISGAGLVPGTITNAGTVSLATIAAGSLSGNSATVAAVPTAIAIGGGLSLASGTLAAAWQDGTITTLGTWFTNTSGTLHQSTIPGNSLVGNASFGSAEPGAVNVSSGLDLSIARNLTASYQAGTLTTIGSNLTLTAGTLAASAPGTGTVTQIIAGLNLTGGTITNSGTVALQASPTIAVTGSTAPMVLNANTAFTANGLAGTDLHIAGADAVSARLLLDGYGASGILTARRASGTKASPTVLALNDQIFQITANGYNGTIYTGSVGGLNFQANEAWSSTANGTRWVFNTVNTGTTATTTKMVIGDHVLVGSTTDSSASNLQVTGTALLDKIKVGVDGGPQILQGAGAPALVAPSGSMFLRNDGSVGARTYINQNGTSSWAAIAGV